MTTTGATDVPASALRGLSRRRNTCGDKRTSRVAGASLFGGRGQRSHHLLDTAGDALVAALELHERARYRIRHGAAFDRGGIEIPEQHDVPWLSAEAIASRGAGRPAPMKPADVTGIPMGASSRASSAAANGLRQMLP